VEDHVGSVKEGGVPFAPDLPVEEVGEDQYRPVVRGPFFMCSGTGENAKGVPPFVKVMVVIYNEDGIVPGELPLDRPVVEAGCKESANQGKK
jgi:hypothetical protein